MDTRTQQVNRDSDGSEFDYISRLTMFGSSDSSTIKKISPQTQKNPAKKMKSNQAESVRDIKDFVKVD